MKLTEKHSIKKNHKYFSECDNLCFLSKNLYNCGVYLSRQSYFAQRKFLTLNELHKALKSGIDYKAIPAKVSQLVLKQVEKCFKAYSQALKSYHKNPSKFLGEPKLPKYKHKVQGRNVLCYNYQAISTKQLKQGIINPSGTNIKIKIQTNNRNIKEVRIIPKSNKCYVVEIVYEIEDITPPEPTNKIAAVDIGLNNLATVSFNTPEINPFIVCGKALKSSNQFYNKVKAHLQSQLPKNQYTSNRIQDLTNKRNSKVDHYLHTASRYLINQLIKNNVTLLIIGKNDNWKQGINIGKKNNQSFTQMPHARFIEQIKYKAELAGIHVIITEESYTSKCSFLDLEKIQKHEQYQGKRIKRGLFKASTGKVLNADLNGSLNIMRKVVGDSLFEGQPIERLVVSPVRVKSYKANNN